MIAQRFRALGWVAGIACAATGLYLISLQVAAERAKLEDVDRRISAAHRDMRQLQTELGTRASLRQLEKFNAETLALAAPRASQYVHGDLQMAALTTDKPTTDTPLVAVATVAAARPAPATAPTATAPAAPQAIPAVIRRAAPQPAAPHGAIPIERVAYAPASNARMDRVAMVERAVVDRGTLGDLLRTAARERRKDK